MVSAEALALGAALCLGGGTVIMKHGLRTASRDLFVFVSLAVQAVLFASLALVTGLTFEGKWLAVAAFAASGLIGSILARYLSALAVDLVGVALAYPVRSTAPLFSAVVAVLVLGEAVTPVLAVGTVVVVIGVAVLCYRAYGDGGSDANTTGRTLGSRGQLLSLTPALLSAALFVLTPTMRKFGLNAGISVTDGLALTFTTAFVVFGFYFLSAKADELQSREALREARWFVLTGLLWSIALGAYFAALNLADTVVVVPLFYTSPLFAIGFSWLFLRDLEVIDAGVVLGAACVTVGSTIVVVFG
jgi:drug/metabolite transporter (DMT)-like permease